MKVITSVAAMKAVARQCRLEGRTTGLVPTMGCLHEGHISLLRASRSKTDVTVASLFVNPAQFAPGEDFQSYPRDLRRDREILEKEGVAFLFLPETEEMYPPGYKTYVGIRDLENRLCGRSRPGHFRGVAAVVLKLFNIIRPHIAFFGWKDAQQVILLKRMVEDLNLDVRIEGLPVVRDADGLALSSRNSYLTPDERRAALVLTKSLQEAKMSIDAGEKNAGKIIGNVKKRIEKEPLARIDYVDIVDEKELLPVDRIEGEALLALAVFIGRARLIDNLRIRPRGQ